MDKKDAYSYLDRPASSQVPPKGDPPKIDFQVPMVVAVTGPIAEEATIDTWRKISADPQTYGIQRMSV